MWQQYLFSTIKICAIISCISVWAVIIIVVMTLKSCSVIASFFAGIMGLVHFFTKDITKIDKK
jgi:hypothetical protein